MSFAMSSVSVSGRVALARRGSLARCCADESLLVAVAAIFVTFVAASAAPYMLWGDSWLTLLGGREIAAHGIPGLDTLTVMSHGRRWIDQQWLAQLTTYGIERAVGLRLTLAVFCALVVAPFLLALRFARRGGASPRSVAVFAVVGAPAFLCAVRAQAFSYLLFVVLLALLVSESRRPTRRVWFALPLLALWANLHGAVLVGAALVCLLGASEVVKRRSLRGAALVLLAPAMLFVSPYGLSLLGYYRATAGNPLFAKYILEWAPPTFPTAAGLPFFVTAAAALVLVARRPRELTLFEGGALALTLVGGLTAERSITWFSYASLLVLPRLLEQSWPQARPTVFARRALAAVAVAAVALGAILVGTSAVSANARIRETWPPAAVLAVRRALEADPGTRVIAAEGSADWLLYEIPELRGRVAFDGRWEVYAPAQFRVMRNYLTVSGARWERIASGYDVVVFDPARNKQLAAAYARRPDVRVLYRSSRVAVLEKS
jgi:hypothetical protein